VGMSGQRSIKKHDRIQSTTADGGCVSRPARWLLAPLGYLTVDGLHQQKLATVEHAE